MNKKNIFGVTEETTKQKLEKLQGLVIDKYIEALEGEEDIHFRDMSPIISLLNQNAIVEERGSSTIEEEISQRIKDAEERRSKNMT